jgi:hypothetical protein
VAQAAAQRFNRKLKWKGWARAAFLFSKDVCSRPKAARCVGRLTVAIGESRHQSDRRKSVAPDRFC